MVAISSVTSYYIDLSAIAFNSISYRMILGPLKVLDYLVN
jgi:hypothetical protein